MTAIHHEKTHQPVNNIDNQAWPKFCQACLSTSKNKLRDMTKKYMYDGRYEIYSEMLDYCFSMQMDSNYEEYVPLICESCIKRLREVVNFKIQVEDSQFNIKQNTGISTFLPTSYLDLEKPFVYDFESIDNEVSTLYDDNNGRSDYSLSRNHFIETPHPMPVNTHEKIKKSVKSLPSYRTFITNNSQPTRPNASMTMAIPRKSDASYKALPYTLESDQVQCKICSTVFDTNTNLQAHMPIHFPNFTCDICGNVFANGHQFESHMQVHSKEKNECPTCKKVFKAPNYLKIHMKTKHGSIPYECNKCQHCGERFNSFIRKQRHMDTAHGISAKEYKCRLCDTVLKSSGHRARHMRKFHISERKHICSICYVSFCERGKLVSHMLTHTGIKKYHCSVCKKKFGRSYTLKEHMKIHTGEKRFVCPICHRAFTQKCSLKGHMAVHRRVVSTKEID